MKCCHQQQQQQQSVGGCLTLLLVFASLLRSKSTSKLVSTSQPGCQPASQKGDVYDDGWQPGSGRIGRSALAKVATRNCTHKKRVRRTCESENFGKCSRGKLFSLSFGCPLSSISFRGLLCQFPRRKQEKPAEFVMLS